MISELRAGNHSDFIQSFYPLRYNSNVLKLKTSWYLQRKINFILPIKNQLGPAWRAKISKMFIFFPSPWPSAQGCVHQSCTADTSLREKLIGLSSLGVGDFILRSLTFKICSMPDYGWAMVTKIVH